MLLGLMIGVASGLLQFYMLSRFTKAVTGGSLNTKAVMLGIGQFITPLVVLLICAFLLNNALLWAGIGIVAALTICALARFIFAQK